MSKVVLDSSAVLAMLQREPGGEFVVEMLAGDDRAVISAVNVAEVVTKAR